MRYDSNECTTALTNDRLAYLDFDESPFSFLFECSLSLRMIKQLCYSFSKVTLFVPATTLIDWYGLSFSSLCSQSYSVSILARLFILKFPIISWPWIQELKSFIYINACLRKENEANHAWKENEVNHAWKSW